MDSISFKATGSAFRNKNKYDLRSLEYLLTNYRLIIDHTLPLVLGRRTLSRRMISDINYEVEIKHGSLATLLDFAINHQEELFSATGALASADGGKFLVTSISKLISDILDFRRKFTDILENGKKPKTVIGNDIDASIINNSNISESIININNPIILIGAETTKPAVDRIIKGLDGKRLKDVSIGDKHSKTLLTKEDTRITGTQKEVLPKHVEVVGRLDKVHFSHHSGTMLCGAENIRVTWDEEIRTKIHDVADVDGIIFKVRLVFDRRKFKDSPVAYHILDCRDPQISLDF